MRWFGWFRRRDPIDGLIKSPRYVVTGHDQAKGAEAFKKSRSEALTIRAKFRVSSRDVLHRVK